MTDQVERDALLQSLVDAIEAHDLPNSLVCDVLAGVFLSALVHAQGPAATADKLRHLADQIGAQATKH